MKLSGAILQFDFCLMNAFRDLFPGLQERDPGGRRGGAPVKG